MKVEILAVQEDRYGHWVHLASSVGKFWARWGEGRPGVGREAHVELEIEQAVVLGKTAFPIAARAFSIAGGQRDAPVALVGRVVDAEPESGTLQIQLDDSRFQVSLEGQVPTGTWIWLEVAGLIVFDRNL